MPFTQANRDLSITTELGTDVLLAAEEEGGWVVEFRDDMGGLDRGREHISLLR